MKYNSHSLAPWSVASFAREFVPIYPLYAIMFGEFGVSPFQLSILLSVWAGWAMLLEVPSGAWADKYSRKWLMAAGGVIQGLSYLVWLIVPTFWGFLAGFLLWGTAGALLSGTTESLLFDTLRLHEQSEDFTRIYGRMSALGILAGGLSMIIGGWLIIYGYPTVLFVSAAFPLAGGVIAAIGFRDAPRSEATPSASDSSSLPSSGYFSILWEGLRESATNRAVLLIVLVTATLLIFPSLLDEFIGPALNEKGFSKETVGYLFGFIFMAKAVGSTFAHRLHKEMLTGSFLIAGAAGGALLASAWGRSWIVPTGFALCLGLSQVADTALAGCLQHSIRSASRATVTSVNRFVGMITGILFFLAFGAVANYHGMRGGVLLFAVATIVLAAVFLGLGRVWKVGKPVPQ